MDATRTGQWCTPASTLMVIGGACVVLGGLVAAATGPLGWVHGSWLAAYLVLVCGVAQFVVGWMQSPGIPGGSTMPERRGWAQVAFLTLGNGAVIIGTLTRTPLVVDAGALLLVVALWIALVVTRTGASPPRAVGALLWGYRVLLLLLVLSLPIGSVLAHVRAP